MKLPWCGLGGFITARPEMGTENLGKKKPVPQIVDSLMSLIGVKSPSQPSCFFMHLSQVNYPYALLTVKRSYN